MKLGWMSALLLAFWVQALVQAGLLLRGPFNVLANRCLAALLVVIAGMLTPYVIGYAGAYDTWPWLSYAPFAVPLALGPLALAYVTALTGGRLIRLWHFAPGLAQFLYQSACFALPLDLKDRWHDAADAPFVSPVLSFAGLASLIAYSLLSLRVLARYRAGLARQRSDNDLFAQQSVRNVLGALAAITAVRLGFEATELLAGPLSYFDVYPYYLALCALAAFLGMEGWRNAGRPFPQLREEAETPAPPGRDWAAQGAAWQARLAAEGWHREPGLTLADAAARLGTNTGHLSRAFNEGLGRNFSEVVNGLRAEAVAEALTAGARDDLTRLAFDAGFASKASFNRAFRQRFGAAPSAWRRLRS